MRVARDKDGELHLFSDFGTLEREGGYWKFYTFSSIISPEMWFGSRIDRNLFPDLKWEDEPIYCTLRTNEELNEIRDKVFYDTKEHCEKYTIDLLAEYLSDEYGLSKTELEETIKQFYAEK